MQNLEAAHLDREPNRADVEKIAQEDGEIVSEQSVDRWLPAPHDGFIDDVVMDERRSMDELGDGAILRPLVARIAAGAGGDEEKRRTDALATAAVDIATTGLDELELALHFVADDLLDGIEIVLDLAENIFKGQRGLWELGTCFGGRHSCSSCPAL